MKAIHVAAADLEDDAVIEQLLDELLGPDPDAAGKLGKVDATHDDGAMVAVYIPSPVAGELRKIAEGLGLPDDAELETPENMHVTLAFLPDREDAMGKAEALRAAVSVVAAQYGPLICKVQGYGMFNGQDGQRVLFGLLDCPDLPFIRTAVCHRLDEVGIEYGKDYGFVPHITLAYLPVGYELPAGFAVPDIPCQIDGISIAFGQDVTLIKFGPGTMPYADPVTGKLYMPTGLDKHCGVCDEDDAYYGAPISREVPFSFPGGEHANDVEIVAMIPDDLPAKPALWKPEGGELPELQERIGGPQYPREEAAYLLDRSLGFQLVPVAYVAETDDEIGAAIYYTFGMGDPLPDVTSYAPEWVEKAAVLDYIMSQTDRGYKHNYGTHPDDPTRPILYDNGLGFPADPDIYCESPFCEAMLDQELSVDVIGAIVKCAGDAATWADIANLVGPLATAKAMVCAKRLIDERAITSYHHDEPELGGSGPDDVLPSEGSSELSMLPGAED